jgi:hypothetical protein
VIVAGIVIVALTGIAVLAGDNPSAYRVLPGAKASV